MCSNLFILLHILDFELSNPHGVFDRRIWWTNVVVFASCQQQKTADTQ